jgi:hypothetical protein
MTLGMPAENSFRFPGRGQDFRRHYFKVAVKHIRLRQVELFKDMHVAIIRDTRSSTCRNQQRRIPAVRQSEPT